MENELILVNLFLQFCAIVIHSTFFYFIWFRCCKILILGLFEIRLSLFIILINLLFMSEMIRTFIFSLNEKSKQSLKIKHIYFCYYEIFRNLDIIILLKLLVYVEICTLEVDTLFLPLFFLSLSLFPRCAISIKIHRYHERFYF